MKGFLWNVIKYTKWKIGYLRTVEMQLTLKVPWNKAETEAKQTYQSILLWKSISVHFRELTLSKQQENVELVYYFQLT